jgi:glycosyltransferase involved in cell wall biosynthesis
MRILIVSNLFAPRVLGGYEQACARIAAGLAQRGHDVVVLTSTSTREAKASSSLPVERTLNLRAFERVPNTNASIKRLLDHECMISQPVNSFLLLDAVRRLRPDHVILFNLIGLGGLGLIDVLESVGMPWTFNLGDNVPVRLVEGHSSEITAVYGADDGAVFSRGLVSAVSQTLVDEIRDSGIPLDTRVDVIPRGIASVQPRSRPYLDRGRTRFVAASSLHRFKGIDIIVDAAARLARSGRRDFTVEIFGGGDAAPFRARAEKLGIADLVTFPGFISPSELMKVHARSDAFLFPTWEREPGASAPFEAAAAGCLPILTATCGPAERLVDGIHCIKIRRDPAALAHAMEAVCDGLVDLEAMREACVRLIEGDLAFDTSLDRLETLLRSAPDRAGEVDPGDVAERRILDKDAQALELLYAAMPAA